MSHDDAITAAADQFCFDAIERLHRAEIRRLTARLELYERFLEMLADGLEKQGHPLDAAALRDANKRIMNQG